MDTYFFDKLADMFSTTELILSACVLTAILALFMIAIIGFSFRRVTLWHVLVCVASGFLLAGILEYYADLVDWIRLGLTFENLSASVYTVGVIVFGCVLLWNLLTTKGRTAVR